MEDVKQISEIFGFKDSGKNYCVEIVTLEERQIVIVAVEAITSLATYFSTKEIIEISFVVDDDELIDTSNHII